MKVKINDKSINMREFNRNPNINPCTVTLYTCHEGKLPEVGLFSSSLTSFNFSNGRSRLIIFFVGAIKITPIIKAPEIYEK